MATYTDPSTMTTTADTYVSEQLMTALKDNPTAITEGAAGAPQIQTAALVSGERMNTTNVLASTASAAAGALGTYAMLKYVGVDTTLSFGETKPASELRVSSAVAAVSGPIPAGTTWRCMGYSTSAVNDVLIWLRTV